MDKEYYYSHCPYLPSSMWKCWNKMLHLIRKKKTLMCLWAHLMCSIQRGITVTWNASLHRPMGIYMKMHILFSRLEKSRLCMAPRSLHLLLRLWRVPSADSSCLLLEELRRFGGARADGTAELTLGTTCCSDRSECSALVTGRIKDVACFIMSETSFHTSFSAHCPEVFLGIRR